MGAKRYLLLRRMGLPRRDLRTTAPGATGLTEIAAKYGFWQFGRLAVRYKSMYGEKPSDTLRRANR
jgi:hypothetical protein